MVGTAGVGGRVSVNGGAHTVPEDLASHVPYNNCRPSALPPPSRFWKCPNGEDCKYRHALPHNYVLKSQMKELLEEVGEEWEGWDAGIY